MAERTIISIGGGELRERTTLKIDEYIAGRAKARAGIRRANALFLPTASHDFMPYYNTFHKVYTGVFDIKTDVALCVFKDADLARMREKFEKADMIYAGGGDTVFMIEQWKKTGLLPLIREAYERGVVICGLSAGAICWFSDMYTDSATAAGLAGTVAAASESSAAADMTAVSDMVSAAGLAGTVAAVSVGTVAAVSAAAASENAEKYSMFPGLGWIKGKISPHYGARMVDFDKILCYNNGSAYGLEDNSAILIENETVRGAISSGGTAWKIESADGELKKSAVELISI